MLSCQNATFSSYFQRFINTLVLLFVTNIYEESSLYKAQDAKLFTQIRREKPCIPIFRTREYWVRATDENKVFRGLKVDRPGRADSAKLRCSISLSWKNQHTQRQLEKVTQFNANLVKIKLLI